MENTSIARTIRSKRFTHFRGICSSARKHALSRASEKEREGKEQARGTPASDRQTQVRLEAGMRGMPGVVGGTQRGAIADHKTPQKQ